MDHNDFEKDVITRLTKIETKLDDFSQVKEKNELAYLLSKENKERLDKIEDNNKWIFRTAIGALISSAIGLIKISLH